MSAPPSFLVYSVDADDQQSQKQQQQQQQQQQHIIRSSTILNMISGFGGVTVSHDTSSVRVCRIFIKSHQIWVLIELLVTGHIFAAAHRS